MPFSGNSATGGGVEDSRAATCRVGGLVLGVHRLGFEKVGAKA